ncbi:MAG: GDSL-type esterase/lipase family protein [Ginsengibacter sp.]
MKPPPKKTVIFFGDSITQMGMNPGGFILRMNEILAGKGLSGSYNLLDAGVGYDKVYDLYLRMDSDVLAKNPDIVFIWVGVNDVGHKVTGTGTDPEKFDRFYTAIIKKLQEKNIRLVLVTPAVIGERTDETNPQDGDLNYYAKMVKNLGTKYNCPVINMRKNFQDYDLKNNLNNEYKGILTVDGIHPTDKGNQLIADEMMQALLQIK